MSIQFMQYNIIPYIYLVISVFEFIYLHSFKKMAIGNWPQLRNNKKLKMPIYRERESSDMPHIRQSGSAAIAFIKSEKSLISLNF